MPNWATRDPVSTTTTKQNHHKEPIVNELKNENYTVHDLFYISNLFFSPFFFWGVGPTLEMEFEASCILANKIHP